VLYFSSRLAHSVIYAWGVPVFRTLSFLASWAALIILVLAVFRIVDTGLQGPGAARGSSALRIGEVRTVQPSRSY